MRVAAVGTHTMKTRAIKLLAMSAALAGCPIDVVVDHYGTVEEAREDRLFERGWLPDLLPPSAHAIRTANNVDLSTSQGHFEYSDTDAATFFRALELGAPQAAPVDGWQVLVRDYRRSGHVAWRYRERLYTWVFFCHPTRDECDYIQW